MDNKTEDLDCKVKQYLDKAKDVARLHKNLTTTILQRELLIGYYLAAELLKTLNDCK